jgi:CBS domain-containing protein
MSHQTIRDVMTIAPVQVHPSASIAQVAELMREQGIGAVLVTDGGDAPGLVTDRDLVIRALAAHKGPDTEVREAVTAETVSVGPEDDVESAVETMRSRAIRRLPVVENGQPVGIVSLGDLAELRDPRSVLGAISAAPADTPKPGR